jgi:hypothetical protein
MEISPIAGINLLPVRRLPPAEAELSAVFDIVNAAKPGDDSNSGKGRKAAGGQNDEDDEPEEGNEPEAAAPAAESGSQVSYFA